MSGNVIQEVSAVFFVLAAIMYTALIYFRASETYTDQVISPSRARTFHYLNDGYRYCAYVSIITILYDIASRI